MAIEFDEPITAGTVLIREAIQSQNYTPGTAGWIINQDGTAEFNDVTTRGDVHVGDSSQYVEITPSPLPAINLSTSNPDQQQPAEIGYPTDGSADLMLRGPDFGNGQDALLFEAATALANQFTRLYSWNQVEVGMAAGTPKLRVTNSGGTFFGPLDVQPVGSGALFSVDGTDQGKGIVSSQSLSANVSGITTTEVALMTLPSMTFENGRAYKVTLWGLHQSTTANTYFLYRLRKGSATTTGTIYKDQMRVPTVNAASTNGAVSLTFILENNSGADITTALTWTGSCAAGTGIFAASAGNLATATVEDVGSASDWRGQPVS